jgi:hypothetical protein
MSTNVLYRLMVIPELKLSDWGVWTWESSIWC